MSDNRLPKRMFYGELATGKRSVGGQFKQFKHTLKVTLKNFDLDTDTWERDALDRDSWRGKITGGAKLFEEGRIKMAQKRREERKKKKSTLAPHNTDLICPICSRNFLAQIGLSSHMRAHQRRNKNKK